MAITTKEITFENEIEYSLIENDRYNKGELSNYNREFAIDTAFLFRFLKSSQPREWDKLVDKHGAVVEENFLKKLHKDLDRYGMLHLLRHGIVDTPAKFSLCFFKPASSMNQTNLKMYEVNILSITS